MTEAGDRKVSDESKAGSTKTEESAGHAASAADHPEERLPVKALSIGAIRTSSGVDEKIARKFSARLLKYGNEGRVVVICLDIRDSTSLMLNLEDLNGYATTLAKWVAYVKHIANHHKGWFDKFTGDGAIVFWEAERLDGDLYQQIFSFISGIQYNFIHDFFNELSHHAGAIPGRFGLGIGVDYGKAMLSELSPPDRFTVRIHHRDSVMKTVLGGTPITGSITVLGRPIVGASRLADAAKPYEALAGPQVGIPLIHNPKLLPHGCKVEQVSVELEAPYGEQIVYRLHPSNTSFEVESHFPHLIGKRSDGTRPNHEKI